MTAPTLAVLAPSWSPATLVVLVVLLLVVAAATVVCVVRARRLDLLHRRTDAARAGLADALERRGAAALQVAAALQTAAPPGRGLEPRHGTSWSSNGAPAPPHGSMRRDGTPATAPAAATATALRATALDALTACRRAMQAAGAELEPCEAAENALTRRLAAVDRGRLPIATVVELAEAEQLVLLARRVHNDAVRDTLDLRSRRLVRWLRLAGTAAVPAYFEIADPPRHGGTRRAAVAGSSVAGSSVAGSGVVG